MFLHVAVVPIRARLPRHEAVGEGSAGRHGVLRHVGHAVHVVRLTGAVEVDGVRQVVRVVERDFDGVALFHAQRRARQPRGCAHGGADRRKHPERDELAGVDLFLDFDDFEMKVNLVGIAIAVEIRRAMHGAFVRARDRQHGRFQVGALDLAATPIGGGQREAVELRDELEIRGVVRTDTTSTISKAAAPATTRAASPRMVIAPLGSGDAGEWAPCSATPSARCRCRPSDTAARSQGPGRSRASWRSFRPFGAPVRGDMK